MFAADGSDTAALLSGATKAGHSDFAMAGTSTQRAAERIRTKAMQRASEHFQAGDLDAFYETLTVASFRNSRVSVTLANPALPDVPLVGVSQGFEQMTGYSRSEILGRNCRFLSRGCPVPAEVRHQMRLATRTDKWFRGVLVNRRKNGETFSNLLHMCSLKVGNSVYILGLQADVTNSDVDLGIASHMQELDRLVDAIFASNVDTWAALQVANFGAAKIGDIAPYVETQLVPSLEPDAYAEARDAFVLVAPQCEEAGMRIRYSNTFLAVDTGSRDGPGPLLSWLRRVSSEPALASKEVTEMARLPLEVFRDSLSHLRNTPLPGLKTRRKDKMDDEEEAEMADQLALKSLGSELHPLGCTPCSFFCYSQMGCNRGELCAYCHMEHPKRTRRRGKKKNRGSFAVSEIEESGDSFPPQGSGLSQQARPAPTPLGLLPLLGALELLSPLPTASFPGSSEACEFAGSDEDTPLASPGRSGGVSSSSSWARVSTEPAARPHKATGRSLALGLGPEVQPLTYSEDSIVVARGQWKQIVPFISGWLTKPLTFAISPSLPLGLSLRRHSGVISGAASEATPAEGVMHRVTAECAVGSASILLHVLVLESVMYEEDFACKWEATKSNSVSASEQE